MSEMRRTSPVTAAPLPDYSRESAREAVRQILEGWPGLEQVGPGTRAAVKVNIVSGKAPETAVTTNPVLVAELSRQLVSRGAQVTVGDSPGGLFTKEALAHAYRACGMTAVEAAGASLNYDTSTEDVKFPQAARAHVFSSTSWLKDADVLINFTKLKTHGMVRMTASVKNLFGTVPGTTKPEYHMRFPDQDQFCDMLIDLNEYYRPALNLVDAGDGMEGNGPTAGRPRHIGLLLASESPYDLDMACAYLIGFGREDVPTLERAWKRGLGPADISEVDVIGEKLRDYQVPDFSRAGGVAITFTPAGPFGKILEPVMIRAMRQVPKVRPAECVSCGKCASVCPAHAITMSGSSARGLSGKRGPTPHIDRSKCIRCFCCQEFCPVGAMKVHRTWLARLLQ